MIAVRRGGAGDRWERELQKLLSDELLPPASPTVTARDVDSPSRVGFLVGSYAEYAVPHVWLHGDHLGPAERTAPLALEALRSWRPEDSLWLLVAELVRRVAGTARPFQVDWADLGRLFRAHFDRLPLAFMAEPPAGRAEPANSGAGG